ncbi:P-loop containing nucleoside triphosphate hydrolase protein, partial [Zopfochytrium polystomum]
MDFKFDGLSLRLPTGRWILKGVTGEIRAGGMTAIMGPSGAGKTTFMSVLMGKVRRTGGTLTINGAAAEMERFRKLVGYVPQEDIMLREMTVRETLTYAARVRLPDSWSNHDIANHVDNVIEALNLTDVAHTPIGDELKRGISGGQRKRVNIGMELCAAPLALFLDEPTSGLDATAALDVVRLLQAVCGLGLTVVSVIHQPRVEIFRAFDAVLMIVPGGRTAYLGPVATAQTYFETLGFAFEALANPADVMMDILAGRG